MSNEAVAQYPLGQKVSDGTGNQWLGTEAEFSDADLSQVDIKPVLSNFMVEARFMKMTGAGNLAPGSAVKFSVAPSEFDSNAGAGEVACGVIDPWLPAGTTIDANDKCWVIFRGPSLMLSGAALGANVPLKSGASGQYADGSTYDATSLGRSIAASTGAGELQRVLLDCSLR